VSDQTGLAVSWRRGRSERCRCGGATCRKWRIRAATGVEWLSVSAVNRSGVDVEDRSHGNTEARQIGAASMWRCCWSGSRWRHGGAVGRSHGNDTTDRRRGDDADAWQVTSDSDLEMHSV
jgi:hypothetical protein